jgi:hypothetical protein
MINREDQWAFIVGAPRCGTTSLSRYLKGHPSVCFSAVKEPHFFAQYDLRSCPDDELRAIVERDYLQRYFPDCPIDAKVHAEGSVSYLYAGRQLEPILRLWPKARFIVALRDPMSLLPSLHQRSRYNGDETVADFQRAWELTAERRQGRNVPRSCADPRLLDYQAAGMLGSNLAKLFEVVGRERCFISFYDDLIADPATVYRNLLDFLGLPHDGRTDFSTNRAGKHYRLGWLQRALKRPPVLTRSLLASEQYRRRTGMLTRKKNSRGSVTQLLLHARKQVLEWNTISAPRVQMSEALRREIRDTLKEDIELLSRLTGRNLDHWLDVRAPAGSTYAKMSNGASAGDSRDECRPSETKQACS